MNGFKISRLYGFVRGRQLDGTYPGESEEGVWAITTMRIMRGWGSPAEEQWQYDGHWPPGNEPPEIDVLAKSHRIEAYQRVRSTDDCKRALSRQIGVSAGLQIAMEDWTNPNDGLIPMPTAGTKLDGAHCVALMECDNSKRLFKFWNNWGDDWGDQGYGYLPYEYFEKHQLESWMFVHSGTRSSLSPGAGIVTREWGLPDHVAGGLQHCFELFDTENDECIAWSFVVERDGFADIEELFVRPAFRGKGYGRGIADMIKASPKLAGLPLRLWVSHADRPFAPGRTFGMDAALTGILMRLGLSPRPSDLLWAPFVAT